MYSGPCATSSDDASICASNLATGGLCEEAETVILTEERWGDESCSIVSFDAQGYHSGVGPLADTTVPSAAHSVERSTFDCGLPDGWTNGGVSSPSTWSLGSGTKTRSLSGLLRHVLGVAHSSSAVGVLWRWGGRETTSHLLMRKWRRALVVLLPGMARPISSQGAEPSSPPPLSCGCDTLTVSIDGTMANRISCPPEMAGAYANSGVTAVPRSLAAPQLLLATVMAAACSESKLGRVSSTRNDGLESVRIFLGARSNTSATRTWLHGTPCASGHSLAARASRPDDAPTADRRPDGLLDFGPALHSDRAGRSATSETVVALVIGMCAMLFRWRPLSDLRANARSLWAQRPLRWGRLPLALLLAALLRPCSGAEPSSPPPSLPPSPPPSPRPPFSCGCDTLTVSIDGTMAGRTSCPLGTGACSLFSTWNGEYTYYGFAACQKTQSQLTPGGSSPAPAPSPRLCAPAFHPVPPRNPLPLRPCKRSPSMTAPFRRGLASTTLIVRASPPQERTTTGQSTGWGRTGTSFTRRSIRRGTSGSTTPVETGSPTVLRTPAARRTPPTATTSTGSGSAPSIMEFLAAATTVQTTTARRSASAAPRPRRPRPRPRPLPPRLSRGRPSRAGRVAKRVAA